MYVGVCGCMGVGMGGCIGVNICVGMDRCLCV